MNKFETLINELSWVPLPFLSDLEWAVAKAMVNNPSLQDSLPTVGHVLSDLIITQHRLDRNKVARLANDGITDGGLCFQRNGKKYIWDGHHRYFAAQQIGKPTCQMKTFDMFDQNTLDGQDKEGMSVQDFASQLRCRVSTLLRAMDSSDRRVYEEKEMSKFESLKKDESINEDDYAKYPKLARFFHSHRMADRAANDLYSFLDKLPDNPKEWSPASNKDIVRYIAECVSNMEQSIKDSKGALEELKK